MQADNSTTETVWPCTEILGVLFMLEAIRNFEQISSYFVPVVLVTPGIVFVLCGICLWLGGLRWIKQMAAFVGLIAGFLAAFFLTDRQKAAFIIVPIIGVGFALFFERLTVIVVGAALVLLIVLIAFVQPALHDHQNWEYLEYKAPEGQTEEIVLDWKESFSVIKSELALVSSSIRTCIRTIKPKGIVIAVLAGLIYLGMGYFQPRLMAAVTCSAFGTMLIILGMMCLLLYKGSDPMSYVYDRVKFYGLVTLGMIIFGTITELVLCTFRRKPIVQDVDK